MKSLSIPEEMPEKIAVKNGCISEAVISVENLGNVLIAKGSEDNIKASVILPSYVYAPIKKGDKVGELRFYCGEKLLKAAELRAAENADKKSVLNVLSDVMKYIVEF